MNRTDLSHKETKQVYLRIKSDMEKAGFTTSWRQPFFAWLHPEWGRTDSDGIDDPRGIYVSPVPVPLVTPHDFAEAHIHVSPLNHIAFSLTFYFTKALDRAYRPHEFDAIYSLNEAAWYPALRQSLKTVQRTFALTWDVEYDCHIENSLCGSFPLRQRKRIVEILSAIRDLADEAVPEAENVVPIHSRTAPAWPSGEGAWQLNPC